MTKHILDFSLFEQKTGIIFTNKNLLKEALTHRSYLNENSSWGKKLASPHNERLEFLGDAVLELIVTEFLFKNFPSEEEGKMTSIRAALVNYQALARAAGDIELDKFILLSRGEAKDIASRAREVILANAFEAFLGAIYLDVGYDTAQKFIGRTILSRLDEILEKKLYKDAKSDLQETVQEKYRLTPTYAVLSEEGPDHAKVFRVGVYFGDKLVAEGSGLSKQDGEMEAAKKALESL